MLSDFQPPPLHCLGLERFALTIGHKLNSPCALASAATLTADQHSCAALVHTIQAYDDYFGVGAPTQVVALCYDVSNLVPPIKAATQASRRSGNNTDQKLFNIDSEDGIPPSTGFQEFLRAHNNRDLFASHVGQHVMNCPRGKEAHPDAVLLLIGMPVPPDSARSGEVPGGAATPRQPGTSGSSVAAGEGGLMGGAAGLAPQAGALPGGGERGGEGVGRVGPGQDEDYDVMYVRGGEDRGTRRWPEPEARRGPGIGEGELSTTHVLAHHCAYTGRQPIRSWMVYSNDTDQVMHILLAMATGAIPPTGENRVHVTVRQRKAQGASNFVDVNRVYGAICDVSDWKHGGAEPEWLSKEAKVVLFTVVFFLGGCDFLPAIYNMTFTKMLGFVMTSIGEPGLFPRAIVKKTDGRWGLDSVECVKMLGVCYFQLHKSLFETAYPDGPAELFGSDGIRGNAVNFLDAIRETIFLAKGANGKKNCPHWEALLLHAHRAGAVLEYWLSALEEHAPHVSFEGRGWATTSGKRGEKITKENVVTKLSPYACLEKGGRLRLSTCGCKPDKAVKHGCKTCKCGKGGNKCVVGWCKCCLACEEESAEVDPADADMSPGVAGASRRQQTERRFPGETLWLRACFV